MSKLGELKKEREGLVGELGALENEVARVDAEIELEQKRSDCRALNEYVDMLNTIHQSRAVEMYGGEASELLYKAMQLIDKAHAELADEVGYDF